MHMPKQWRLDPESKQEVEEIMQPNLNLSAPFYPMYT